MATVIRREIRKRGFFGWLFLILFFAFNVLMLLWLVAFWNNIGAIHPTSAAAEAGRNIGAGIATGVIFFFWAAGALILGLCAMLTRGRKTIIEETSDEPRVR
jgi:hypothetical protein